MASQSTTQGRASERRSAPALARAGRARIAAAICRPPEAAELRELNALAGQLEVRADLAGDLDPAALRRDFDGALVYSLRSRPAGGESGAEPDERARRLEAAAGGYDAVELEHGRDTREALLRAITPKKRRVSAYGPAEDLSGLTSRYEELTRVAAGSYLLAPSAGTAGQTIAPLELLRRVGRRDLTAFARGPEGTWTRLLAPRLGAPIAHGYLGEPAEEGALTVRRLVKDFGLPILPALRDLYGIAGGSVSYSLAPRIYNRGFRALGLAALCLPFSLADFEAFWSTVVHGGMPGLGVGLRGLTVVTPHKEAALAAATLATPRAREAGAANSLVRAGGSWQAATTSRIGGPLAQVGVDAAGLRAAVIGCGGAGRSLAAALRRDGADVTLVNRGATRGEYASSLLGLPWRPLEGFSPQGFDLLVNATPLRRRSPVDVATLADGTVVVDLVYAPNGDTALLAAARGRGLLAVGGRRVLASETATQFELMTGQPLPPEALEVASEAAGDLI